MSTRRKASAARIASFKSPVSRSSSETIAQNYCSRPRNKVVLEHMFQCSGVDLIGQTYGRLSVLRFSHEPRAYRRYWVCRCACGTERILREDYIKSALATCATCRRAEIANRRGPRMCSSCREMLPRDRFSRDRTPTRPLPPYSPSCSRSKAQTLRPRLQGRRPEDIVQPDEKQGRERGVVQPAGDF